MSTTDDISKLALSEAQRNFWLYKPYPKQQDFHNLRKQERALFAGNQLGKTLSCGYETAFHLTGIYPDWFKGRRFDHNTMGWAAGVTSESTRDVIQHKLFGKPREFEGGIIHKNYIVDYSLARGVPDLLDTVFIRHRDGGVSQLQLKSYEKGREKWQGPSLDFLWLDEEPPMDIYMEALSRTNATNGIVYLSFTPLQGMSNVVLRYWKEPSPQRGHILMGLRDITHIPEDRKAEIINSYPEHEREARVNGIPILGSGRVFPLPRDAISHAVPQIPSWWPRIVGIDFGWDHPTAAVWLAWDRDADRVWVYDCYRASQQDIMTNAAIIRSRGDWIPVAWPHDGLQHDKGSGLQIAQQYRQYGLNMLPERATFTDGTNGVEAGVMMMLDRMRQGKLYVAPHLTDFFEEFELYHRKDGKIEKVRDDILSATRYAIMMLRHAISEKSVDDSLDTEDFSSYSSKRNSVTGY